MFDSVIFNAGLDSRADRDLLVEAHKRILMIKQRVLVGLLWRVVGNKKVLLLADRYGRREGTEAKRRKHVTRG